MRGKGEIRILTKRDRILGVADRWYEQYQGKQWAGNDKQLIYLALKALDLSTATEDDIEAIIGNRFWTQIKCDQCEKDVDVVVMIGGSDEYGPDTICGNCVYEAAALLYGFQMVNEIIHGMRNPLPMPKEKQPSIEDAVKAYAAHVEREFLVGFPSQTPKGIYRDE